MSLLYVPLMAAKSGEFTALSELKGIAAEQIKPLLDLPTKTKTASVDAIKATAVKAGKAWKNKPAYIDITKWTSDSRVENGMHVLEYAFNRLKEYGIKIDPVIGYDRWDDPAYQQALKNICQTTVGVRPCIRLDSESVKDDLPDTDYFFDRLTEILDTLDIEPIDCTIVLDLGDVSKSVIPDLIAIVDDAINTIRDYGILDIVVAGGSMPDSVNKAVKNHDSDGHILRNEVMVWKAIFNSFKDKKIVFGDYTVRNPKSVEGIIALNANAKIRYTVQNQFYILRGHSKQVDSLALQNKDLAKRLVASSEFSTASFSWGDAKIEACANGILEIKSPTTMIAIDTNHHIQAVVSEIYEHQRTTITTTSLV